MSKKILKFDEISYFVKKFKGRKKLVLCHGVFDLLHIGHIKHFEDAKKQGDILIVSITPDKYVNKGPNKPYFNEKLRLDAIAALKCVDYVILNKSSTSVEIIKKVKPNIYCKGKDYKNKKDDLTGNIQKEINAVKANKGKIYFTHNITFSSSSIINSVFNIYSKSQRSHINKIKNKFTFKDILKYLESFKKIKVLVIGETIIDNYNFCEAIGKAGKESTLVFRNLSSESYVGGAAAIARHLSSFCKKITLLTLIGNKKKDKNFIRKRLPKNITLETIGNTKLKTIKKTRFVENSNNHKIFGLDEMSDSPLGKSDENNFKRKLKKHLKYFDLVIVTDYGHGFISKSTANFICKNSKFLSVCTQINASNSSYHTIENYKNLENLIFNERELRHELRDRSSSIEKLMNILTKKNKIKNLIITQGSDGSKLYSHSTNKFFSSPAYAIEVKDKVGAGDAMLSIISLCLKSKMDKNLSLFISSICAAQNVSNFGNKIPIKKMEILKSIENILK